MTSARAGRVTLRFYRWDPPCLSLGRNERARGVYDGEEAARRGVAVVRRPTGGRAVYHHDELTYAVAAPAGRWGGLRESYALINRALSRGLAELGVPVVLAAGGGAGPAGGGGAPGLGGRSRRPGLAGTGACFAEPAAGEVTAWGRKLVGSAQWRNGGALLQHGSILLSDGQGVMEHLRSSAAPGAAAPWASGAVGLEELLSRRPGLEELAAALLLGFRDGLGCPVETGRLSPAEGEEAERLEARYRDAAWTWRR